MREVFGSILFSATDLMRFMGCAHSTALDLTRLRSQGPEPGEESEAAHLEKLKFVGKEVLEVSRSDLVEDAQPTDAALAQGAEVVFQGVFLTGTRGGWSDFLLRVDHTSALWPLSDDVAGTKLKRSRGMIHLQLFCRVSALRSLLREDCSIR